MATRLQDIKVEVLSWGDLKVWADREIHTKIAAVEGVADTFDVDAYLQVDVDRRYNCDEVVAEIKALAPATYGAPKRKEPNTTRRRALNGIWPTGLKRRVQ